MPFLLCAVLNKLFFDFCVFCFEIGIAPSKDSYWSMPTVQNNNSHYGPDVSEPFNRLQSLVLTLSNGLCLLLSFLSLFLLYNAVLVTTCV